MFLIFIISLIIYIIAGIMLYHNIYNYDKVNKIKIIIIGFILTLVLTVIICFISSNGINTNSNYISIARNASILLFAPINAIIVLPYMGNLLNKYKGEKISDTQLKKKLLIFFIILIVVFVFETAYIKDFEMGLVKGAIRK